jgi:arsenate reductase
MTVTIYHNPRCSKSRETLALLEARGVKPKIIEYLKTPPTEAELKSILRKLALKTKDLVRETEPRYAELGLKQKTVGEEKLLAVIAANPILLQRPIVINGNKAAIGRPPEKVLEIL